MSRKLLAALGKVDRSCTQSHITYTFHIEEPADQLRIEFSYSPKLLEDKQAAREIITVSMERYGYERADSGGGGWEKYAPLQNLLTLSLDDPQRHRGAAHRPAPQQRHVIGEGFASPGFVPGANPAGLWRLTLSLHAVVTETCDYRIEVWEEEESDEDVGSV
ncbi:hypothetical protein [Paenibacillus beijingensis]|uniref:hypothetical protein n=1 Tax=Paenibacillus beijingensis TaxID=1126833 RepID=UPI000ABF3315|nr:hypothetical protein [Paenibacillus beijingensis]